jgi:hypothetical protein
MSRRIVRVMVYVGLVCLPFVALSDPFLRQSVFGPKIHGVPVYAWEHDARRDFSRSSARPSLYERVAGSLGFRVSPTYIDDFRFPHRDPELLPILLTLADDNDQEVRYWVALYLGNHPNEPKAIAALEELANDPVKLVREQAQKSLDQCRK